MNIKAARSSETPVSYHITTQYHNLENNLKLITEFTKAYQPIHNQLNPVHTLYL